MTGFVMFLHAAISILLVTVILMQSGRGGGLTEGFASAESMFGAQTNEFMIKATTVITAVFLATCLGLAVLSAQSGKSLMAGTAPEAPTPVQEINIPEEITEEIPVETTEEIEKIKEAAEAITVETGAEESRDVPATTPPAEQ